MDWEKFRRRDESGRLGSGVPPPESAVGWATSKGDIMTVAPLFGVGEGRLRPISLKSRQGPVRHKAARKASLFIPVLPVTSPLARRRWVVIGREKKSFPSLCRFAAFAAALGFWEQWNVMPSSALRSVAPQTPKTGTGPSGVTLAWAAQGHPAARGFTTALSPVQLVHRSARR